jgi:diacylglycerol kinase family enzyme
MMNIGFDCSVVAQTLWLKEKTFLRGSAAYIGGVAKELLVKKTTPVTVELSDCVDPADGSPVPDMRLEQRMLLTAAGNGSCCGGGFHALPLAELDDGYMDVLVVNDVSRMKFVALVGDYRAGTYVNERGALKEKFRPVLRFVRCRRMRITGPERFCLDGEIFPTGEDRTIEASVMPLALNYVPV